MMLFIVCMKHLNGVIKDIDMQCALFCVVFLFREINNIVLLFPLNADFENI